MFSFLFKTRVKTFRQRRFTSILILTMVVLSVGGFAQQNVVSQNQLWIGYMTSTEIGKHYAWWNDFHYVPEGFLVVRTGLTRNFKKGSITGGYAHLWLPAGLSNLHLARNENRPWAQVQFSLPVNKTLTFNQRTRYDARFKQNVWHAETVDGYTFNNRIRFLFSLRKSFPNLGNEKNVPFVALSDEVLFNFGGNISGFVLDQNRISFTLGVQRSKIQYQIGYMNRLVQLTPDRFVQNHTLLIWVTQKFSLRKHQEKT